MAESSRGKHAKGAVSLAELTGAIYEAALEPEAWKRVSDLVRVLLNVQAFHVYLEDLKTRQARFSIMENLPLDVMPEYYTYYYYKDPNVRAKMSLPVETVTATNRLMPDRDWENTEYYYDFMRRGGLFYQMGAFLIKRADLIGGIGLARTRRMGSFAADDVRKFERLVPHLSRAFRIHEKLRAPDKFLCAALGALDRLKSGIFLSTAQGQIFFVNAAGQAILRQEDGLSLRAGRLAANSSSDTARLYRMFFEATLSLTGESLLPGGAMPIPRPSGKAAFLATVVPLAPNNPYSLGPAHAAALAMVTDPSAEVHAPAATLVALFGLTPAEARIALALANGQTPKEAAERQDSSVHTVRKHIKQLHDKLGVRTLGQLVRKVLEAASSQPRSSDASDRT